MLVVAGLAACSNDDGQFVADTTAEESTTTLDTTTTAIAVQEPPVFVADASLIADRFVPLDPGTYRVDAAGTPFSFTSDESLFIQPNGKAMFVLTHPGSNGPDDRDIVVLRISALSDPTELISHDEEFEGGWPANDFSGWLDNLTDSVVVSNRHPTTLGGLDATFAQLGLDEPGCPAGTPCTTFGMNNGFNGKWLFRQSTYRIWMVDQGDEDPLAVIVGINREADIDWFDTADDIIATLAFGAIGPNPVLEAVGAIDLDFLGGIRTELAQPAIVVQEPGGYGMIGPDNQPGDAEFLIAPNDTDGNAVETADDLVAVLEGANVEVSEIEATEIGGFEARVFEIGSNSGAPLLTRTAHSNAPWSAPQRGRMWLVEHPERGLLMITAEASANPDTVFPVILAQTEPIIESMEFIELG